MDPKIYSAIPIRWRYINWYEKNNGFWRFNIRRKVIGKNIYKATSLDFKGAETSILYLDILGNLYIYGLVPEHLGYSFNFIKNKDDVEAHKSVLIHVLMFKIMEAALHGHADFI